MADQTPEEMQARLTNYEEGMEEIATALIRGTVTPPDAADMLRGLIGLPGHEHLKALRDHEASVSAMMAFKDWALREVTTTGCPKCAFPEGKHETNCPVATALQVQHVVPVLDVRGTIFERLQDLQHAVADYVSAVSEPEDPQELVDLKTAYQRSRQLI